MTKVNSHQMYVELYRERNRLKARLKEVQQEIDILEPEILDQFLTAGVNRIGTTDGATLYVRRSVIPKPVRREGETPQESYARAYDALVENGLDHLAKKTFHWQSVASAFRELEEQGLDPKEMFKGSIEPYEKFNVSVLGAGKGE